MFWKHSRPTGTQSPSSGPSRLHVDRASRDRSAGDDHRRRSALDPEVLGSEPEIAATLEAAAFTYRDKDALDALRLLQAIATAELATTISSLATHEIAGPVTQDAVALLRDLALGRAAVMPEMVRRAVGPFGQADVSRSLFGCPGGSSARRDPNSF